MFKAIQKMKGRKDRGFTLVELLIVVAIIGILAAIAIPQFGAYRRRGYNASALSDSRNIRTTEEAMQADFQEYGATAAATGGAGAASAAGATINLVGGRTTTTTQTIALSPGVITGIESEVNTAGTSRTDYLAITAHQSGDNYYGVDNFSTRTYRRGFIVGETVANLQSGVINEAPTAAADELGADATWIGIQ